MKLLKIKFKAVDSGFEEVVDPKLSHGELVKFLALGKARATAKKYPKAIIIAADTMVSFKGRIIGKPKNKADTFKMLKSFNGKPQDVVTGAVVMDAESNKFLTTVVRTQVYFKKLSDKDILNYIASGESLDKAGGYGPIGKGINLIARTEGEYTASLGLPMKFVLDSLAKFKVKV